MAIALVPFLPLLAWPLASPLQRVMLVLVALVGGITLAFSQRYLHGRADLPRYSRWFLATLASACGVILARDLLAMALAWTATSLSLHQLLTFMPGRPRAEIAAHKKFLLSRFADLAVLTAVALLWSEFHTTDTARLLAAVTAAPRLPIAVPVAGLLIALGVILRSAQLPFHGWLIQVMEAPTPVSALLHAGIVNLGAFVLIRLAPLFDRVPAAQLFLGAVGTCTAVVASLVLLTQGTVKGALAWSTCAQMGFVLLECGLGAYDLALLHIVAHALYKAHAFLRSGSAVREQLERTRSVPTVAPTALRWTGAIVGSSGLVGLVASVSWGDALARAGGRVSLAVLVLTISEIWARTDWRTDRPGVLRAIGVAVAMPLVYAAWHLLFARVAPVGTGGALPPVIIALVALAFVALLTVSAIVTAAPAGRLARALYPRAVAGFHLDELFTRLTFQLWPPTLRTPRVFTPSVARPRVMRKAA